MKNPIDKILEIYNKLDRSGMTNWPLLAAALSFYTALAVVPILAICFALAKSLGFEQALNRALLENFAGQEAILNFLTGFANNLIRNFSGSLLVFTALAFIFWSVYGILWQLEVNFSRIFGYLSDRKAIHRATDYLTIMLVIPFFLIAAGSSNVFIESMDTSSKLFSVLEIKPLTTIIITVLPVLVWWLVLAWTYAYFSRGVVRWKERLLGGFVAGLAFQLFQKFYLKTIIAITSYNAIYGSFALVPLFMIWLYISWIIVITGGEITRRLSDFFLTRLPLTQILVPLSYGELRRLSIKIMNLIIDNYKHEDNPSPLGIVQLASTLKTPIPHIGRAINCLQKCNLLTRVADPDSENGPCFLPSISPDHMSDEMIGKTFESVDQV